MIPVTLVVCLFKDSLSERALRDLFACYLSSYDVVRRELMQDHKGVAWFSMAFDFKEVMTRDEDEVD